MRIAVAIELPAAPQAVWDYVSDLGRGTEWMADAAAITFTSETQTGVGTTFECLTKVGPFKSTDVMTVTEWEEPTTIGVEHNGLVAGTGRFTLAPSGDGTYFSWAERLTLPWRFGGPLLAPLVKRILTRIWRKNLRQLRVRVMERTAVPQPTQPGALVGRGRSTEMRTYGDHVVRINLAGATLTHEAQAMAHVRSAGFPVPETFGQPEPSQLVMERIDAPTMLDEITSKPWLVNKHARTLAHLHRRLGDIDAPDGWVAVSDGTSVCHLDLGPDNVKMTANGPVVMHWENAARGDPAFDAAVTYTILRTSPSGGGVAARAMVAALRQRFARAFIVAFGEDEVKARLRSAAELRLLSRDLMPTEREAVFALARGELR